MNVIFPPETAELAQLKSAPVGPPVNKTRSLAVSLVKQLLQCTLVAMLAYGSYILITSYVVQTVEVVGVSMTPTLRNKDHYLLNRWAYLFHEPKPNDIVVLRDPTDNSYAVKRIVARAGDSIYLKGGHVYVNGKLLPEPYLPAGTETFSQVTRGDQMFICGDNRYFVMGDNRMNSLDSRIYGTIPRENIIGTVMY